MNIAYWLRLVSLALYMTDPGRVDFDPTLMNEYAATGWPRVALTDSDAI